MVIGKLALGHMDIHLSNIGKRYKREWIFKGLNLAVDQGRRTAIIGPNGSGKSTLMAILSGFLSPSKGKIAFLNNNKKLDSDIIYQQVSIAAPYIELIEEMTLTEAIQFHATFKTLLANLSPSELINICGLQKSKNKQLRHFSSGMKQRVKLALAICSTSDLILLDEPTTNLDQAGADWYQKLLQEYLGKRTLFIASNVSSDYKICNHSLSILDYK